MKPLLLLSLLIVALAISPEPIPTCSRPDITLKDLPISPNEMQTYNLNDIFKGYNLNYTLIGQPSWVQLRPKFNLQKSQKLSQPGLKSIHLDHVDNYWGKKLVTVSDAANSTIVRWGSSSVLDAIPTVNNSATVESDPKITCFDAIWLNHTQLIVVDCVRVGSFALQNIFLYLNATTQQVIQKQVVNDMWIAYTSITRRKIVHYIEDGEHYLFRAYFADAVNEQQRHNTYAEILLFNDPFRPWAIKVLDRSFLNQDALSITDFKEYLGDLYILDYHKGVVSFDITPSQNIVIKGRYRTDSGYHRMGIYSNNLADEVLLALANQHGIYEIDWTNQYRPTIIAKYSLMEGSRVSSLWVNQEYIACQLRANVTNSTNQTEEYHSTIIFDRGTRTYTNAYAVIHHSSYRAVLDLNIQHSTLLSIDEDSIDTYFIDEPYLFMWPQDEKDLGKEFNFTVKAESKNENNGQSLVCTFDWRFVVVKADSLTLWQTGIPTPSAYFANFPGQLAIPLTRYIIGANITYGISEKSLTNDSAVPNHWIYQQNDTIIHWAKQPSMFKYTFLRKQQFEYMNDEYFFIYSQDSANVTHIANCRGAPYSKDIKCQENSKFEPINFKINNFTATAFLPNYGEWLHLVATVYEEFPNEVFIYNVQDKMDTFHSPIIFDKGWEGRVQSIEFLGHYLVVVLRHIKTLVFYDMKQCHDQQGGPCKEIYRVDSIMMDKLNVPYFSPLDVYTSDFHPFVLFIQNVDSVIILDITKNGPVLLQHIESPASREPGFWKWKMAISRGHLVIVNPPNLIEEYQLNELYTRKITQMTKQFPVYNYTILDSFDLDAADNSDMVYITAIDKNLPENKNTVIMVYRTNTPAVAAFYDIWHVEGKYDEMLIDVTGVHGDYVTVAMGSILMMYRQYGVPILIFEDNWNDFEFNVTYTNDPQHRYNYSSYATVKVANYPEKIVINDSKLNQTDFLTNSINYQQQYTEVILDDTNWFNGTVLNYTVEGCGECGNKIKVVGHMEDKRDFLAETDMEDYVFTRDGGVVQQFQSLIKMKHNGSIDQVVQFPSILDGEHCTHVQHSWVYDYTLSACQHLGEIYLYTTTYTSFKPFVNGPFYSGAKYVSGLHIMEDILVLVDVEDNPQNMNRQGGILIMAMNHDPFDPEMFDLIEVIGDDDLEHAVNWPGGRAFIGSAQLLFTNQSSLYRLVITEIRHGLFFVDFKFSRGRQSIEITKVEFVDLNKLMVPAGLHMPNLAYFWGVAVPMEYYNTQFNYWQYEIVVTTTRFHTLKFDFHVDKTGTILQSESKLSKVFYRYGYYDVAGFIRHFDGYFAIIHNLPNTLEPFEEMSRKVLSLYDTRQRWVFNQTTQQMEKAPEIFYENTTVPASYMLGGMRFKKGRLAYDFNVTLTRNRTDPFRDISLLVLHDREAVIREVLIHDHIKLIAEAGIEGDQHGFLKANSDFNSVAIPLRILGIDDGLSGGAIAGIIIGSILVVVGLGYLAYRWNLKRKRPDGTGLEDSLIDRETLNVPKDEDADDDEDDDEDEDDEEEEEEGEEESEEEEETEAENEPIKLVQPEPVVTVVTGEQEQAAEQKPKEGQTAAQE